MNGRSGKRWVALLAGTMLFLGGCSPILQSLAVSAAWDFIGDNDLLFDFFGDDGPGLFTQ